jgi:hypothetical protein
VSDAALEQLRAVARLGDLPPELAMLLETLSADELARLEYLAGCWPAERGAVPRAAVRRCLDWPVEGRG